MNVYYSGVPHLFEVLVKGAIDEKPQNSDVDEEP